MTDTILSISKSQFNSESYIYFKNHGIIYLCYLTSDSLKLLDNIKENQICSVSMTSDCLYQIKIN